MLSQGGEGAGRAFLPRWKGQGSLDKPRAGLCTVPQCPAAPGPPVMHCSRGARWKRRVGLRQVHGLLSAGMGGRPCAQRAAGDRTQSQRRYRTGRQEGTALSDTRSPGLFLHFISRHGVSPLPRALDPGSPRVPSYRAGDGAAPGRGEAQAALLRLGRPSWTECGGREQVCTHSCNTCAHTKCQAR